MEIVLAALVAAGGAGAVVMLVQRPRAVGAAAPVAPAGQDAAPVPTTSTEARDPVPVGRDGLEEELLARRSELARLEERLRARESSLEVQGQQLTERERSLDD